MGKSLVAELFNQGVRYFKEDQMLYAKTGIGWTPVAKVSLWDWSPLLKDLTEDECEKLQDEIGDVIAMAIEKKLKKK